MRIPHKRYSETLRTVAPILAEENNGREILRILVAHERANGTESEWDIAEALYWIGAHCHNGMSSSLYRAMCATHYRPSPLANGPGDVAREIYNDLLPLVS